MGKRLTPARLGGLARERCSAFAAKKSCTHFTEVLDEQTRRFWMPQAADLPPPTTTN